MVEQVVIYLVGINGICWAAFGMDKHFARSGRWRIPERLLLGLAALGGTPGAFHARRWFRHKTRKQPFSSQLIAIAVLQVLACAVAAYVLLTSENGL